MLNRTSSRGKSGLTLIVVLMAMALMMILLLMFFAGMTHQLHNSAGDAFVAREKMLADSAVALVIGQISQASTTKGQAWISQPGLVRTYTTGARQPTASYKLYSTTNVAGMVDTSGSLAFLANDVPSDWNSRPADFTDLNTPIATPGIFSTSKIYPILDPGAVAAVKGISINTGHSAEMPVAWLYELQDGTLGPASNATAANPIVARMAFWTDDETSKININTAGCGSSWSSPHTSSPDDIAWGQAQPASGQFSAYPGHPATTSLAVVFGANNGALSPQQLLGLSPRYPWLDPNSNSGVTPKIDRLYASVDELSFGASVSNGQRAASVITPGELELSRFFLTAHSNAPETTLLGEPRVAIWPVADSTTASHLTATDRAIMSAATVGTRDYYFQRNNPQNPRDDFDPGQVSASPATASNLQLFNDLLKRGTVIQPGTSAAFNSESPTAKYPDANWTQLMLEITDFIHSLNAVDPSAAPFAPGDANGIGRGFVEPLTMSYGTGSSATTLRGFGRCPTLSSLTLVFYVCGFRFKTASPPLSDIDFDLLTDDSDATTKWNNNFTPGNAMWQKVASELIRCFIVPCTYQPGCGFPEVSDACTVQLPGFTSLPISYIGGTTSNSFGFTGPVTSLPLGTKLKTLPEDRRWGGNEGPVAWREAADALQSTVPPGNYAAAPYPFASTSSFAIPMSAPLDPGISSAWPSTKMLSFPAATIPVVISDLNSNTLQTLNLTMPAFTTHAPTINGECTQADPAQNSATPNTNWISDSANTVPPWWYMCMRHRLFTSQNSRVLMIQAGDVSRSVEAGVDLRVISSLATVPASMFQAHQLTGLPANAEGGSHAHNIRFADGTSVCFAPGNTNATTPIQSAYGQTSCIQQAQYPANVQTLLRASDWRPGATSASYNIFTTPPCSVPTGAPAVYQGTNAPWGTVPGDWDTGPGYAADGAQINLPDAGTTLAPVAAYQSLAGSNLNSATQRAPNALVPSPVIFGSLPSGINPVTPTSSMSWQTLLFCPYPAAQTAASTSPAVHAGAKNPPDHLLLDNFWMPVVEPYAISTCMTTAGKINLNDQIAPFTYLHRSTALRALFDDLRIPAIPVAQAVGYKSSPLASSIWNAVDADATVAQIESRFANSSADAYLSESEICTVPIVPLITPTSPFSTDVAATQSALATFWDATTVSSGGLTGDNLRELPYAQLYGRLTTRSNSYTVHVRVQVLKKLKNDPDQTVWKEGTDVVLGDWRGSYEIERYLDPAAPAPVAGSPLGGATSTAPLGYYKFRIVSAQKFSP